MRTKLLITCLLIAHIGAAGTSALIGGINYNLWDYASVQKTYNKDKKYRGNIILPDSISHQNKTYPIIGIDVHAFADSDIESIVLPKTLEYIGRHAFEGCRITEIDIPNSVSGIETMAFCRCKNLKHVKLPDSLLEIDSWTFVGCDSLNFINLPKTIIRIDDDAFSLSGLKSITIPAKVDSIGARVFVSCKQLEKISVDPENKRFKTQDGVLYNRAMDTLICYPAGKKDKNFTIPQGVLYIRDNAFQGTVHLSNVFIPQSVKTIGNGAFYYSKIDSIHFPAALALTKIGYSAFESCKNLKSIDLAHAESLKIIDNEAFRDCTALRSISFPKSLTASYSGIFSDQEDNIEEIRVQWTDPNDFISVVGIWWWSVKCKLYVPQISVDKYRNTLQNCFSEIIGY